MDAREIVIAVAYANCTTSGCSSRVILGLHYPYTNYETRIKNVPLLVASDSLVGATGAPCTNSGFGNTVQPNSPTEFSGKTNPAKLMDARYWLKHEGGAAGTTRDGSITAILSNLCELGKRVREDSRVMVIASSEGRERRRQASTGKSWKGSSGGRSCEKRPSIIRTESNTTTGRRTSNCGRAVTHQVGASKISSLGLTKSSNFTEE